MTSFAFSRQDLLKTFMPLSESGKTFLEVMLVNPKTSKPEGRGYFNDLDFLLEACGPHAGRYNFCLSNFGYAADTIPTRASCNQFDRTLLDGGPQEKGRAHSLSVVFLFKPELIREMTEQSGGGDHFLNIVYQLDGILGRLGCKSFSLDYFLTGMVARFAPSAALQRRPVGKAALAIAGKRLVEAIERQMTTQEQKRFALGASILGKVWDPLPGLPGLFAGEGQEPVVAASSGSLQPCEDAPFAALLDEALDGKPARNERASQAEPYAPNFQGLSQNWMAEQFEPDPVTVTDIGKTIEIGKSFSAGKAEGSGHKGGAAGREPSKEVLNHLLSLAQGRWRWPLASAVFNRVHQGSACGEMLLLQSDPFAADLGFNFLMQCAEGLARDGSGQIAIFSKGRSAGELALPSLCRHYKANPLEGRQGSKFPDAAGLAKVHASLFPNVPHIPAVGRGEGLDNVVRYLEHDYLIKQKKHGSSLMPLAIILDNIDEFWQDSDMETCKRLAALKQRLREINGTLWVTQLRRPDGIADPRAYLGLADHVVTLDHDGGIEASESGRLARPPRPGEWEAAFHLDHAPGKLPHDISLVKLRFQAHGSHRVLHGQYVYYRNACLFREVQAAAAAPQPPQDPPQRASAPDAAWAAVPGKPSDSAPAKAPAPVRGASAGA